MKLLILGILMEKDRHPYDIRQTMIIRRWNHAFRVRDGSLYYAVDQLREKGFIEAVEVVSCPDDHRPDKTIYRITEAGRAEFMSLFYSQLKQPAHPQHPMMIAMPFLRHGDQERIAEVTQEQLTACESRITQLQETLSERGESMPSSARRMIEGMLMYGEAELEWLQGTLEETKRGAYNEVKGTKGKWKKRNES